VNHNIFDGSVALEVVFQPGFDVDAEYAVAYIVSATAAVLGAGIILFHYVIMDLYIFFDKLSKFLGDRFYVHF
jgi:hypothetical protein